MPEPVTHDRAVRRSVARRVALGIVPVVAAIAMIGSRTDRLEDAPDAGVFLGMVRNLRGSLSLTSVTDQFWVRLSPAETVRDLGHLPIADFGPAYPSLVAAFPLPLDRAFVGVHAIALVVAVLALGALAFRATTSVAAAVGAQIVVLWGPSNSGPFFADGRPLDLFASIGPDAPATAAFLLGLALLVVGANPAAARGRRVRIAWVALTAVAFAASALMRYAYAGALVGVLAGLLVAHVRDRDDRRWRIPALAVALTAGWYLLAPLVVGGAGPKAFAVHRRSIAPLGSTLAGWVGIDVTASTPATAIVVVVMGVLALVAWRSRAGRVIHLAAVAALGQLIVLIASLQLLDASINLREERHVLLVRFLVAILVVAGVVRAAVWMAPRLRSDASPRLAGTIGVAVLVAISILATSRGPGPAPLTARPSFDAGLRFLEEHPGLPVLTNEPDDFYVVSGVGGADLPRGFEVTTDRPRDVDREIADLAAVLPGGRAVLAFRRGLFETTDPRTLPCAEVVDRMRAEPAGFEFSVVDLSGCRARKEG